MSIHIIYRINHETEL